MAPDAGGAGGLRPPPTARRRIPLAVKLPCAGFLAVLVPVYWQRYGPRNFLWLSDIALFLTGGALWLESPLLAGMAAVGVLPLELGWNLDLLAGGRLTGIAGYMFDRRKPVCLRGLSLFHVALPPLLLWLVRRLGYDRRALPAQTALTWVVLPATYRLTDPERNVNWVYGPGSEPQTLLPRPAYLGLLMAGFPLLVFLPTHVALRKLFERTDPTPAAARSGDRGSSPFPVNLTRHRIASVAVRAAAYPAGRLKARVAPARSGSPPPGAGRRRPRAHARARSARRRSCRG